MIVVAFPYAVLRLLGLIVLGCLTLGPIIGVLFLSD